MNETKNHSNDLRKSAKSADKKSASVKSADNKYPCIKCGAPGFVTCSDGVRCKPCFLKRGDEIAAKNNFRRLDIPAANTL